MVQGSRCIDWRQGAGLRGGKSSRREEKEEETFWVACVTKSLSSGEKPVWGLCGV